MIKLFKNEASAKSTIRRQGIHLVEHRVKYMDGRNSGYYVEFLVDNKDDVRELQSRGFAAILMVNRVD